MYRNILVAVAPEPGHDTARAVEAARKLRAEKGQITLLSVVEAIPPYVAQYMPEGQLEKNIKEVRDSLTADAGGVGDLAIEVVSGHAGTTLTEYAEENGIDLIVIASHRPGLKDYFLGSTAARVVRHAPCSVHVLR